MRKQVSATITESSGNVFADLGFANPQQEQLKAQTTLQIYRLIKKRQLTQTQVGAVLGIRQLQASNLMRGQSGTFSLECLRTFLIALGQDVEITVRHTYKPH